MKARRNTTLFLLLIIVASCVPRKSIVPFKEDSLTGFRTTSGKVIIQPVYEHTSWNFYNGYIAVKKDGKWGVINDKGKLVIDYRFDHPMEFSRDGYARTRLGEQYGLINTKGETVIPFDWDDLWYKPADRMAVVKKNGKWGFTDMQGKIIIPAEYDEMNHWYGWNNGWMAVCKDRKWGFIDMQNNVVIPLEYYRVNNFSEGVAFVAKKFWEWGGIDSLNNTVIPFMYELMSSPEPRFIDGIALVQKNRKYGYINKANEVVIPFRYDRLNRFYNGYAYAEIDSTGGSKESARSRWYGYIDTAGREYLEPWKSHRDRNWEVTPAPKGIPDFSCLLVKMPPLNSYRAPDYEVFVLGKKQDSLGNEISDTLYFLFDDKDSVLYMGPKPPVKPPPPVERYTLEEILNLSLTAFVEEPKSYPDLHRITSVCASYGLLIGEGNYSGKLMGPDRRKWEVFRNETLFKILSKESLRQAVWEWAGPFYKKAFQTMHPFHQQVYKDIASHLRGYINSYDRKKMEHYLKYNERRFARYDPDGTRNPYRKLCAFTDRLILLHKVVSEEEARVWINRIADEVEGW
jgi:hypothetical protein